MSLIPSSLERNELKYWVFRLHYGPFYVRIQGYREVAGKNKQLECWVTSPISYCEDSRTIITISGRRYILKGNIDYDQTLIYQYPNFLVNIFKDGFPENWERLLRPLHQMIKKFWKIINDNVLPNNKDLTPSTKLVKKDRFSLNDTSVSTPTCKELVPMIKTATLSVTRSGRVIKPRLHTWEGERIAYDVYGNAISAHSATTRAPNNPNYSSKLAIICDGLGVSRLESSKQTHRLSNLFDTPQTARSKRMLSRSKKRRLVDYSSSSSEDSFMAAVDQISLSSSPDNSIIELTPIPLKATHSKRIIQSAKKSVLRMVEVKKETGAKVTKKSQNSKLKKEKVILPSKVVVPEKIVLSETPKKKRWTAEDTKRLKIALKAAVNPQTTDDWNVIARSVSFGARTGEECRQQAIKIRWKSSQVSNTSDSSLTMPNTDNSITRSGRNNRVGRGKSSGSKSNSDFFTQKNYNVSLLDLDPNDSLLSVLKTPREEAKFIRKPFIMQQILDDTRRSTQSNENCDETY